MQPKAYSRRTLLRFGGAAVAGAVLGIGGWVAHRFFARPGSPSAEPAHAPQKNAAPVQAVIDSHVHLVNPNLPGVPELSAPDGTPFPGAPQRLAKAIQAQMKEAKVEHALC